ncbi:MAG: hypothetical protein ACE5GQ_09335, partial [Nitrospinales bacterium]
MDLGQETKPSGMLPDHLKELLQPTPSGVTKLTSVWSALTTETQILILSELEKCRHPAYLEEKIKSNAVKSKSPYVRYLAAKSLCFDEGGSEEKQELKRLIENDSDPLVRYCLLENKDKIFSCELLDNPEVFFAQPQEARLAIVRNLTNKGEAMSALIAYAIDRQLKNGEVSRNELFEILSDYVNKPEFKNNYQNNLALNGIGEYQNGKDIDSLWHLALKLPEEISHVLIENLPEGAGLSMGIPESVLQGMSDNQLETLLFRPDIGVEDFRREIFFKADRGGKVLVRGAAVSHNFDLDHKEFSDILAKPDKEKVYLLKHLSIMANDLSLCLYDAIHDILCITDASPLGPDFEYAQFSKDKLEKKLAQLKGPHREKQLLELRLYRLAKNSVPWEFGASAQPPSGELEFLKDNTVQGNTWATFIAFLEAWTHNRWQTEKLERSLPPIEEIGEGVAAAENGVESLSAVTERIEEKLADIFS